ncbi:hypothetical protein Y717_16320 [Streptomyces scopuliridis RB72]|uniref:Uncharacterized protein n=1 Tax=Streptomyces scopuliridis RB72 TaxID=1440053 RepID=A0A2T7T7Q7_9ACTN|nr:hypothetical protein Y717_16320 [Streptomyces scopuliridis RB72]
MIMSATIGVSMVPEHTALMRTPRGAYSSAGSKTLPGSMRPDKTRSMRSGRNCRTGAGPPRGPTWGERRREQFLAVEGGTVRHADEADIATGAGGTQRPVHRLVRTDALRNTVLADPTTTSFHWCSGARVLGYWGLG